MILMSLSGPPAQPKPDLKEEEEEEEECFVGLVAVRGGPRTEREEHVAVTEKKEDVIMSK